MTYPENATPPWWSAGVVGPRPGDDPLRRAAGAISARTPRWRFENDRESAVVLDVPGYEVYPVEPGRAVVFFCEGERLMAVADSERAGVVLKAGRVEDLAVPDS